MKSFRGCPSEKLHATGSDVNEYGLSDRERETQTAVKPETRLLIILFCPVSNDVVCPKLANRKACHRCRAQSEEQPAAIKLHEPGPIAPKCDLYFLILLIRHYLSFGSLPLHRGTLPLFVDENLLADLTGVPAGLRLLTP